MPKENINAEGGRVAVAWTPGRDVQIGIEQDPIVTVNDEPVPGSLTGGGPSLFRTLDRAGCNRLIRAARKARDAAYGADA